MSVKFFGQFLLEEGEVDADHVREAVRLMKRTNQTLGRLAVESGFLCEQDTVRINKAQLRTDRPFGELAVELGVLRSEQLDELICLQEERRLRMGEALVKLGHLPADRLGALLERFKADQAPYETGSTSLPAALRESLLSQVVVDLLPKFCMRVARIGVKVAQGGGAGKPLEHAMAACISVKGGESLDISLVADRAFAELVAAGISGSLPGDMDASLVLDGVGEFLNVLAGNAVGVLERQGVEATLDPPRAVEGPHAGHRFQLVATTGSADLYLAPHSA